MYSTEQHIIALLLLWGPPVLHLNGMSIGDDLNKVVYERIPRHFNLRLARVAIPQSSVNQDRVLDVTEDTMSS